MKWMLSTIIILLLVSAYGYYEFINENGGLTGLTVMEEKETVNENNMPPKAYFAYKDNLTKVMLDLINDSENVSCAIYDVNVPEIVNLLKQKNAKVTVEDDNFEGNFITGDSNGKMHNKFCILDKNVVFTGSTNPTAGGISKNNNNLIVIHSKYIAENYMAEFNELYNGEFGDGNKVKYPKIMLNNNTLMQNYFCPEDDCQSHVLEELEKANRSIYFMTFSFTSAEIADVIIQKHNNGLVVKGVFEKSRYNDEREVYQRLNASKITLYPDKNKQDMHHKVFIIDEETVITGSYNPTKSGNLYNDENIIIIKDKQIARQFLDEYQRLTS